METREPALKGRWPDLADLLRIDLRRPADKLLVLVLVADAAIIVVHLLHAYTPLFADRFYSLTLDRGLAETIRYYKLGLVLLALLALGTSRRSIPHAAWALVVGLMLWDDLFRTRERFAKQTAAWLDLPAPLGLRPQDLGELVLVGLYLAATAVPVVAAYWLGRHDRRFWWSMVVLLAALFFFSVGVDLVHVALRTTAWAGVLGAVEEGGTTIVITFMLRLTLDAWMQRT